MDTRLAILQAHPEYVELLDQRRAFYTQEEYDDAAEAGLSFGQKVLPEFLATGPKGSVRILAVTPSDYRMFFAVDVKNYSAAGWTGIRSLSGEYPVSQLALIVAPKPDASGNPPDSWTKPLPVEAAPGVLRLISGAHGPLVTNLAEPEGTATQVAKLLKDSLGLECDQMLVLTLDDGVLYCRALAPGARGSERAELRHEVQIWVAREGFYVKTKLLAEGDSFLSKPMGRSIKVGAVPLLPPGWPPE